MLTKLLSHFIFVSHLRSKLKQIVRIVYLMQRRLDCDTYLLLHLLILLPLFVDYAQSKRIKIKSSFYPCKSNMRCILLIFMFLFLVLMLLLSANCFLWPVMFSCLRLQYVRWLTRLCYRSRERLDQFLKLALRSLIYAGHF